MQIKSSFCLNFILLFLITSFFIKGQPLVLKNTLAESIVENASSLKGMPYVAGSLEVSGKERLVWYNDRFDCVTFVEYVLALSIHHTSTNKSECSFEDILQQIRYRNGIIDGYGSRLHYFSEWILQNEMNGVVSNVTDKVSKIKYTKKINFMTSYSNKYPGLSLKSELIKVKQAEERINLFHWNYIPKIMVNDISDQIKSGDIIAITTDQKDLDISHIGFALRIGNQVHLLHASETEGKVVISKKSLSEYLMGNSRQTGIMLIRPTIF